MKKALLAALLASPFGAMASPPPTAPPEVMAAAPQDTTLLFFATSGNQPNADAVAVFETPPDEDGCISLVRDASQTSFPGRTSNPKGKKEAIADAMKACESAGGAQCEEVRTDCTQGIL